MAATSIAYDSGSAARLERLAKRWRMTKAEALSRVLLEADREALSPSRLDTEFAAMNPEQILNWLAQHPQVPPGWGRRYRRDLQKLRDSDKASEKASTKPRQPRAKSRA